MMTADRWDHVQQIYHDALELRAESRAQFLDRACANDSELRREVESLLASHDEAGGFLASPALEVAAHAFAKDKTMRAVGTTVGPYKITAVLGSGGMGEVYLAEDSRFGRKVALKLLPSEFIADESRLRRFQQEARAALALNHPNVITIFEIGRADSTHFIATEFIDGQTLREKLRSGPLTVGEALDISIQVAAALAAAHAARIVHRDIKPENIMLRPDGYVKVLDFGLAKLTERRASSPEATTAFLEISTDPGVVLGTANYMSPEQARGLDVDERGDIFSFGVVLYEMIAGRAPFEGKTPNDVIASILSKEPQPLARYATGVPGALEWTVTKCLVKDKEERYQSARELLTDLRRLKQRLDFESEQGRSFGSDSSEPVAAATTGAAGRLQEVADTAGKPVPQTDEVAASRTMSSAEYLLTGITRHKKASALVLAIIIVAAGYALFMLPGEKTQTNPFQTMRITRLTSTGKVTEAAISPDGKYVAYVAGDGGKQSLWLRQAATNSNVQITSSDDRVFYRGPTFSRDGNYIYHIRIDGDEPRGTLYQVPVLGGEPRKLIADVSIQDTGSNFSFSPDGSQLALVRLDANFNRSLVILKPDGTGERQLASRSVPNYLAGSAWSPDGRIIVCVSGNFTRGSMGGSKNLIEVQVSDGKERPLDAHLWTQIRTFAWLPDGRGLITAASDGQGSPQLWHIAYPNGEAQRITNDLNGYAGVSLTADAQSLASVRSDYTSNVWIAPGADASRAKKVTSSASDYAELNWTPDGKLIYQSAESGNTGIWIMNSDGSAQKHLTTGSDLHYFPTVSPDGRYVLFISDRADRLLQSVWRINLDGSNPVELVKGASLMHCTPDSRWVVYYQHSDTGARLWKIPIEGGDPVQLTFKDHAARPAVSPDGKLIACNYMVKEPNSRFRFAILPIEGGEPIKIFDVPTFPPREFRWTPDGKALAYVLTREGVSNIWIQPIDGSAPKQLTDFKSDFIYSFNWSLDGKQLACARGPRTSDVVLISDFK